MDVKAAPDERGPARTVKSCGPGIPVLMPSSRCFDEHASDRGKKAGPWGERV
jgi:hypothetical protein